MRLNKTLYFQQVMRAQRERRGGLAGPARPRIARWSIRARLAVDLRQLGRFVLRILWILRVPRVLRLRAPGKLDRQPLGGARRHLRENVGHPLRTDPSCDLDQDPDVEAIEDLGGS